MDTMDTGQNRSRFIALCATVRRPGIDDLLKWLIEESDFFTAPASTRFHGAYAGGLLQHSLNVYDELQRLLRAYPEIEVPEESAVIVPLFHDLCKVNFYATEKRNRKNEDGRWESYDAYTIQPKMNYGGHGAKSVFIVQQFMKLTVDEAVAIHNHMSAFCEDWRDTASAFEQYPFAWLVSVADQSATYLKEGKEE